jgi:hypothetical protein
VEAVDKVHGRNKACFCGVAAHKEAVWVMSCGIEGLHDAAVEGNLCSEVGEVKVT